MYNARSLQAYARSAPINFRLLLVNLLLVSGCSYVVFICVSRYTQSINDLDRVVKLAASQAPCGLAVPRTKFILQALKRMNDDAFSVQSERAFVDRVQGALCGASSVTNALRAALQTTEIPEDCCHDLAKSDSNAPPASPQLDLNDAVKKYVCKCDMAGNCGNGGLYGDFVRRISTAYVQAAPAFARYVDSRPLEEPCIVEFDPFSNLCIQDQAGDTLAFTQLDLAATNSMRILAGENSDDAPFPPVAEMLFRLLALSVVEYHDRVSNGGKCFKNIAREDPVAFCTSMLKESERPLGVKKVNGCIDPAEHAYYVERIGFQDSCMWKSDDPEEERLLIEPSPRALRRFGASYADAAPVYAVCASMLEFGLLDRKRLFGLPDPITNFDWYSENHGNGFTRWVAGWVFYAFFYQNLGTVVSDRHTPYIDLKLFLGYRLAATCFWTFAAVTACGYLLAYSLLPLFKLLYTRIVRSNISSTTTTNTIFMKPAGAAEYAVLVTALLVGLYIIFVDPSTFTPYVVTESCADYSASGGPFTTTELRPRDGFTGLTLAVLSAGLLLYLVACRRKPPKNRVFPLKPFPVWPVLVVVLVYLGAVLALAIQAGNDWWVGQSTSIDASTAVVRSTADLEQITNAAFWSMLCFGILVGTLNQRHLAANAVLEVPKGSLPIYAVIWTAIGLAASIVAAVLSWPLFDCQLGFKENQFICGGVDDSSLTWTHFFGGLAFLASALAIVFVLFAAYRVLVKVPRKNSQTAQAFNLSRKLKVQQLAQQQLDQGSRGGARAPPGMTLADVRGARTGAAPVLSGVVHATFVVDPGMERSPLLV